MVATYKKQINEMKRDKEKLAVLVKQSTK